MSAALVLMAGFAGPAVAGTLTLAWDPSQQPQVAGYLVYYGLTSGNYAQAPVDTGTATTVTVTGLQDSTKYYLAVAAYDAAHNISPLSAEVSGTSTSATSAAAAGSTGGSTATGAAATGTTVANATGATPGAGGGGGCAMSSERGQGDFLLTAYLVVALAAIVRRRIGARRMPRFNGVAASTADAGAAGMAAAC